MIICSVDDAGKMAVEISGREEEEKERITRERRGVSRGDREKEIERKKWCWEGKLWRKGTRERS